jgi:hypothetical protein
MGAIDRVQPANPCRFKSSCQAKEIGLVIASSKMPARRRSPSLSDRPLAYRVPTAVDDDEPNGRVSQKMCWAARG